MSRCWFLRTCLDGAAGHRIDYHVVGYIILRALAFHNIQNVLVCQSVELQNVLSHLLRTLFEGCHLFLVAHDSHHIVACHDAQLGVECAQHLQMRIAHPIEHHWVYIF